MPSGTRRGPRSVRGRGSRGLGRGLGLGERVDGGVSGPPWRTGRARQPALHGGRPVSRGLGTAQGRPPQELVAGAHRALRWDHHGVWGPLTFLLIPPGHLGASWGRQGVPR